MAHEELKDSEEGVREEERDAVESASLRHLGSGSGPGPSTCEGEYANQLLYKYICVFVRGGALFFFFFDWG